MPTVELRDIETEADRAAALERLQRQGYGTATLDAVVAYVRRRPGANVLLVSCHQGQGGPQPFYERYGFVPTDRVVEGEVVLELDLGE